LRRRRLQVTVVVEGGTGWSSSSGVDLVVEDTAGTGGRELRPPGSRGRGLADGVLRGLADGDLVDGTLRPRINPMPAVLVAHPVPAVRKAEEPRRGREIERGGGSVGSGAVGIAASPGLHDGRGAAAKCSRGCRCCWSPYSSPGCCILGMQHGLHLLLETV
jgi:hypothetical protein